MAFESLTDKLQNVLKLKKQGPPDGRGCQVCTEGSQDGTVGGRC